MALDTVYKVAQGSALALGSADPEEDSDHIVRRHYTMSVRAAQIGAAAEAILIDVPQTDIEVRAFYMVPGLPLATDANNPLIHLSKGDLAAGALTRITTTAVDTDTAIATRTKTSGVISTTLATRQVAKGTGLYLEVVTQGTPADITEDATLTFVVEYELQN